MFSFFLPAMKNSKLFLPPFPKRLLTFVSIVIFVSILSWGTSTEDLLYLSSAHANDIRDIWWRIFTYPLTCGGILSLGAGILILTYAYKASLSTGNVRMFFIPWCVWSMTGGMMFILSSYFIPHDGEVEDILSSVTLPSLAYMCMLSSAAPFTHMFFFVPRVRLWRTSLLLCMMFIGFQAWNREFTSCCAYTLTCGAAVIWGIILRHRELHHPAGRNRIVTMEDYENFLHKNEEQRRLDAILEKISRVGYQNLSRSEKEFLRSISTKDK